jgi:Dockerin type I domain
MIPRAALRLICAFATLVVVTNPFFATSAYAATAPVSGTANCVGLHPLPETVATKVQIKTAKETKSAGVNLVTGGFSLTMSAVPAAGIDGTATITCDGAGTWQVPVYIPPAGTSSLDVKNPTPIDASITIVDAGNGQPINPTPVSYIQTRLITVYLFAQSSNQLIAIRQVVSNPISGGAYDGQVYAGDIATGNYIVKVKLNGILRSRLSSTMNPANERTLGLVTPFDATANVYAGDLNGDNAVNTTDYNMLMKCCGHQDRAPGPKCTVAQTEAADPDGNGEVDGVDYNIWARTNLYHSHGA